MSWEKLEIYKYKTFIMIIQQLLFFRKKITNLNLKLNLIKNMGDIKKNEKFSRFFNSKNSK